MQAIEFKTETNNGIIKLPYQFQQLVGKFLLKKVPQGYVEC